MPASATMFTIARGDWPFGWNFYQPNPSEAWPESWVSRGSLG